MRSMRALVALTLLLTATAAMGATKRVLLLHSYGRDIEAHAVFARQFRTALAGMADDPVEFYEISLAAALLDGGNAEPAFVRYLAEFEVQGRFDLVVLLGGPATRFLHRHRDEVFATSPVMIAATEDRHVIAADLDGNDASVPFRVDLRGCLENVLRVLPETREVLVVVGASPVERFWEQEIRREWAPLRERVHITFLSSLPFRRVLERVARPSAGTAVFYALMVEDAAGVPYGEDRAMEELAAASRLPLFGVWDFHVGKGLVGGPVIPVGALAQRTAGCAARILEGEPPAKFRVTPSTPILAYDARELARWNIPRSRLPEGSEIRFEEPSFWERHRGTILLVLAIGLGQSALIVWLYASRRQARLAQAELRDVTTRLVAAQEDERARLSRELHDDVTQRLARLAIDAGRAETAGADAATLRGLREGLVALSESVHALSYALHPSILDDLGLVEAIQAECDRVAEQAELSVELVAEGVPGSTPRGAARCLYRVAQEAMRNVVRHARAGRIDVGIWRVSNGLRLTVRDDGVGFDPLVPGARPTLGLASMRERVRMVGGKLAVESAPGSGTTVTAWVPLKEPSR